MNIRKIITITSLISLVALAALSCKKLPEPDFSFTPEENPEAGEEVQFENKTLEASSYQWNFGDGGSSTEINPTHIYEEAGIFEVQLTAFNDAGDASRTASITINESTILGFVVYDSTEVNVIEGAAIWLYDNEADWNNVEDPLMSDFTDADGIVLFEHMEAIEYYIWAVKEAPGGLWLSGGSTPALELNQMTIFNVPCAWIPDQVKSAAELRHAIQKRSDSVPKLQLKPID